MTKPPETVAEFEDLMAKAKAASIPPIIIWNKPVVGLTFPLQNLMGSLATRAPSTTGSSSARTPPSIRPPT